MIRARVIVSLKEDVMDPQGNAVGAALQSLGHQEIKSVRVGRAFEVLLNTDDETAARADVKRMCEELLANTVIERFEISLEPIQQRAAAGAAAGA